jgi:hypothetical protein
MTLLDRQEMFTEEIMEDGEVLGNRFVDSESVDHGAPPTNDRDKRGAAYPSSRGPLANGSACSMAVSSRGCCFNSRADARRERRRPVTRALPKPEPTRSVGRHARRSSGRMLVRWDGGYQDHRGGATTAASSVTTTCTPLRLVTSQLTAVGPPGDT